MKLIIQLIVTIILLSITTLYANAIVYNKTEKVMDLVRNFSIDELIKKEVQAIEQEKIEKELVEKEKEAHKERERIRTLVSRGSDRGIFTATAYDLTVASCGRKESHPSYGITANGTSLKGHTLESIRAIAVDPKVIKLGSKVYIEFIDEEYKYLDGEYTAVDTGSAIKGNKVDIFFGDTGDKDTDQSVWDFGKRKCKVIILPNDDEQ